MDSALVAQLILYGLAAAVAAPVAAVVSALILSKSTRPITSALVFTAGAVFLDLVLVFVVFASGAFDDGGDAGAYLDVGLGLIFAVFGGLAIFQKESPEKDAARRARADSIATAKLATLFVAGIAVQVINFDAIAVMGGGLKEIAQANIDTGETAIATLFLLALMLIPYYAPAVVYALVPQRAGKLLGGMTEWIMGNSRRVEIVTGLAFGVLFLWKGLAVLV
jgi:Sap, sulfolipid-1-addressing protein